MNSNRLSRSGSLDFTVTDSFTVAIVFRKAHQTLNPNIKGRARCCCVLNNAYPESEFPDRHNVFSVSVWLFLSTPHPPKFDKLCYNYISLNATRVKNNRYIFKTLLFIETFAFFDFKIDKLHLHLSQCHVACTNARQSCVQSHIS